MEGGARNIGVGGGWTCTPYGVSGGAWQKPSPPWTGNTMVEFIRQLSRYESLAHPKSRYGSCNFLRVGHLPWVGTVVREN